ncbi:hypothetical protein AB8A31_15810 [Tardiphaga sp. 804_B3_N1_9]|uniref:hypothetical protein n=1 Tax=Tardiphaga sp. 804_B3_N1_9 TaxID=3240786 RepID=UPI003F22596F
MSDDFTQACLEYKRANGHAALRAMLFEVAGVVAMSMVPAHKQPAVISAASSGRDFSKPGAKAQALAATPDFQSQSWVDGVYANWNRSGGAN